MDNSIPETYGSISPAFCWVRAHADTNPACHCNVFFASEEYLKV